MATGATLGPQVLKRKRPAEGASASLCRRWSLRAPEPRLDIEPEFASLFSSFLTVRALTGHSSAAEVT